MNHLEANSKEAWDTLWAIEGDATWRQDALSSVYTRIAKLVPARSTVLDIGGGVGILAAHLQKERGCKATVLDISPEALKLAAAKGVSTVEVDLEATNFEIRNFDVVIATEVIEHLSEAARTQLLDSISKVGAKAFFSVPNDRLGPDEEPQHTIKWTAKEFLDYLKTRFVDARVECIDGYLLGVVGFPKPYKLSVTMPVRDEAEDLKLTLASFRGIADEMVIGVDPRTADNTREVAAKYADLVFDLESPEGPPGEEVPKGGVHFSWMRNQCIEKCTSEWIFMTEGHERLIEGQDTLLALDRVLPRGAKIGFVIRSAKGEQWAFPWLFKKDSRIKFVRPTHNALDYPDEFLCVKLPQVKTLHERVYERELARAKQRTVQNRKTLLEDWVLRGNATSLYYLGSEWRDFDVAKGVERLEQFLALPSKHGPARYQTRLILAKHYAEAGRAADARNVLLGAPADDWQRVEHWVWLGDLAMEQDHLEEAVQFYRYASTAIGKPPFSLWWIDVTVYTYIPAQRLTMAYAALGQLQDAVQWATKVLELLPADAPAEMVAEAEENLRLIEETINGPHEG